MSEYAIALTVLTELPERVEATRQRLGWTQRRVARQLGVAGPTLSLFLRGHHRPSDHLIRACLAWLHEHTKETP